MTNMNPQTAPGLWLDGNGPAQGPKDRQGLTLAEAGVSIMPQTDKARAATTPDTAQAATDKAAADKAATEHSERIKAGMAAARARREAQQVQPVQAAQAGSTAAALATQLQGLFDLSAATTRLIQARRKRTPKGEWSAWEHYQDFIAAERDWLRTAERLTPQEDVPSA